ncbi:MAG: DUF1549 domain-containing protein [Gemmataceae bacterium]|nr:DUF1549 domain-containing protein [Gemmataceae bacterium]
MGVRDWFFSCLVVGGVVALGVNLMPPARTKPLDRAAVTAPDDHLKETVESINANLRAEWAKASLSAAPPANDLQVARRLSLALMGTVPSLEEIRQFESLPEAERLDWWLEHVLRDRRSADFLAERVARAVVGTEDGPFLLYRRRRFVTWLGDELAKNTPYDQVVREMIAGNGLWTDHPSTNFITVTSRPEEGNQPDPIRLAGRVTRAFLGLRLDCAQCHDHPFASWTQDHFEGFAAYFGQARLGFKGIQDGDGQFELEDRKTKEKRVVPPGVPFGSELLPNHGSRRERLAVWVTHPKNPYFARATANRAWAILFGRPLIAPVDNLEPQGVSPDKEKTLADQLLDILADDFRRHGHDLRRLFRVIAATEAFRRDSAADFDVTDAHERAWAVFPLSRLRPEQVVGAMLQSASIATIDAESHIVTRLMRYGQTNDFLKAYGDTGDDEFDDRGGTIPQRLVLMNGDLVRERTKDGILNASSRIASIAPSDAKAIELAYLCVLGRRPTSNETEHFTARLADTERTRGQRLEDLYWTLLNSTEFSWNH